MGPIEQGGGPIFVMPPAGSFEMSSEPPALLEFGSLAREDKAQGVAALRAISCDIDAFVGYMFNNLDGQPFLCSRNLSQGAELSVPFVQ